MCSHLQRRRIHTQPRCLGASLPTSVSRCCLGNFSFHPLPLRSNHSSFICPTSEPLQDAQSSVFFSMRRQFLHMASRKQSVWQAWPVHCQQPCRSLLSTCFCWPKLADVKLEVVFGLLPCEFAWRVLRSDLVVSVSSAKPLHNSPHIDMAPRCLLADDSVLAELVSATPKHLTRLGLARPTVPHSALHLKPANVHSGTLCTLRT